MNITKTIFWILLFAVATTSSLLMIDLIRGDGNGIVSGINLMPLAKYTSIVWGIYTFWYAFKQKVTWLQNIVMSMVMVVLTIALLEWACGFILKKQAAIAPKIEGPLHSMINDPVLGYKPKPDTAHVGVRTKDGKVIYSISYQTDGNSLRITPVDSAESRSKYAQFFGCSMTFGEGVQSNETLPYYFGKYAHGYQPYNFAYSGYGPHQMLARLETNQLKSIVKEPTGVGFYIYINDHVNRVLGTMTNYSYNGGNAPYYHTVGDQLRHEGLFKDTRKVRGLIYQQMLKSNILKLFKIGYPFKITEEDYRLTAAVMATAAKEYQRQFGNDNFYVIIYPTTVDSSLIISLLKEKGVKVLDYAKLFNPLADKYAIPFDEHPTALANEVLIKQLVKDIQ